MVKKCCYNDSSIIFILFWGEGGGGERRWRKEKTNKWSNFFSFFFETTIFGHILKNNQHIHFLGAWSFLLVHIQFTPSEGPKGFVNWFFEISGHGCWTMNWDHERRPSSMSEAIFPWSHFMATLLWSDFLKKTLNQTWTKRSDHAPKSGCANFFLIYVQKWKF